MLLVVSCVPSQCSAVPWLPTTQTSLAAVPQMALRDFMFRWTVPHWLPSKRSTTPLSATGSVPPASQPSFGPLAQTALKSSV